MSEFTLERIMALQAAYIRCIDTGALEAWPDFFVADCLYKVTTADNEKNGFEAGIVYADTRDMLADRILALRQANVYEKQTYRHIVGLPSILKDGGSEAECETPFFVLRIMHDGQSDIFASGVYRDTIASEDGALKFRRKLAVCDSSRIDTLLALPL
jgi:3-phenylpropionate/cinnamic acid dioxygenase small subunit